MIIKIQSAIRNKNAINEASKRFVDFFCLFPIIALTKMFL